MQRVVILGGGVGGTLTANLVARKPGDPLPRMVLDGVLKAEFEGGSCKTCRLWWHSLPQAS